MSVIEALRTERPESLETEIPNPRETMRSLPRALQFPLTVFTGKPLAEQTAPRWTPTFHLLSAVTAMAAGLAVSTLAWSLGGWYLALLLLGWAVTLHGMRNLRMMVYHQCSHRNMYRKRRLDLVIGRATSSLLIIQNFARYSREHVSDHHAAHHMTLRDPTVQAFLVSLGMHPGMTRRQMWRRLLGKLVSPRFHLAFGISRILSFWHESARSEKAGAIALYGSVTGVAVATGVWPVVLVAWLIPLGADEFS